MKNFYLQPPNIIQPIFSRKFNVFKRKPIVLLDKNSRWREVAGLVGLSDKAKLRLEWLIFYFTVGKEDAYKTAKHFGITPKTLYKWLKRFLKSKENVKVLEERSRRPRKIRQWEVTLLEETRVINLRRRYIHWGKRKLRVVYEREYRESVSTWKIERVIRKHKLYPDQRKAERTAWKIKKAKEKPKKRIVDLVIESKLWFLIHLDCIVIYSGNLKRYILTAVDRYGKFAYARMYKTKSSRIAKDFLFRLHYLIQEHIPNIQTDNGSEFQGEFDKALEELKILHWFSRVKTPQDNAPVEKFHQTLEYGWLNDGNFTLDCDEFNKNLTEWLIEYNFVRPHQALNYLTPVEFIEQQMLKFNQNLLPMWSARARSAKVH